MIVCKMLQEDDNEFIKFKDEFKEVYDSLKLNTEDLQKQTNKLGGENNKIKSQFKAIQEADPDLNELKFGKIMSAFLKTTDEYISQAQANMKKVHERFLVVLDLLMVKKTDEMRLKSDKFFEFFAHFFNEVHKSMPKIEEEKKDNPQAAARRAQAKMAAMIRMQKMAGQKGDKPAEEAPKGKLPLVQLKEAKETQQKAAEPRSDKFVMKAKAGKQFQKPIVV